MENDFSVSRSGSLRECVQVDTAYTQYGLQAVLHVDSNKMRKEFFVRLTRLMEVVFASLKLVDNLV